MITNSQLDLTPFDNLEFEDAPPDLEMPILLEFEDVSEKFPTIFDILEVEDFSQETTPFDTQDSELKFGGENKRKSQYYVFSLLKLIVDKP